MYDVIVIGAGHAGCEAALIAAKMNHSTLLITGNLNMAGSMPCNPSIGGPAKGIIVREIDALGGFMGKCADLCQIQTKKLNSSKGPAVWALRFQMDKLLYCKEMLKQLKSQDNLELKEAYVDDLIVENNNIKGVVLENGEKFYSKTVIITTGTYLSSRILRGHWTKIEGPDGQKTNYGISKALARCGFTIQRLKTGTPPRIKASSIDFSKTALEPGSEEVLHFSFDKGYNSILNVNIPCHLAYTNLDIHNLIRENLDKSAMYGGVVKGIGPRYCPSIEDKVVKFSDKERHQIFYEPESLDMDETYLGGFSTSMPVEVQEKMIRLLPGLKDCEIIRYAYAIEYDAIDPLNLYPSLETKIVNNLFTAGQINGTSGYEEAAGQGLIAGINACLKLEGKDPLILKRDEAYIGVMIDDLVTKGTKEPYRLLTSRAEFRLLLRNDNADLRLRHYGYKIGTISKEQEDRLNQKEAAIKSCIEQFEKIKIKFTIMNQVLNKYNATLLTESVSLASLLKRPDVNYKMILEAKELSNTEINIDYDDIDEILEQVEIHYKYDGYIKKALAQAERMKNFERLNIPSDIDYNDVSNIALEAREKLKKVRPLTVGQASRISGVNPADISVLVVYLEKLNRSRNES